MSAWWRRNRWWLLAIPLALALMAASSSYRFATQLNDGRFSEEIARAAPGETIEVEDYGEDEVGRFERDFTVRFRKVLPADHLLAALSYDEITAPPAGMSAFAIGLDFTADPDTIMGNCEVVLIGADGQVYGGGVFDPLGQVLPCLPDGREGPLEEYLDKVERTPAEEGTERPEQWTVWPVVLISAGVQIVEVQLRFEAPRYVALEVPTSP